MRRYRTRSKESGVTLIELLVVATIILTLAAVSVPTIKPMMESQLTSHAASVVSTYLERARARAITNGRSCGVTFEYFSGTCSDESLPLSAATHGSASLVLRQVEVPPYYTGADYGAVVDVLVERDNQGRPINTFVNDVNSPFHGRHIKRLFPADDYWDYFVFSEDSPKIQFNSIGSFHSVYKGYNGYYVVESNSGYDAGGVELPEMLRATFKVQRDPRPTMSAPLGLPQGAVVDLEFSGTDTTSFMKGHNITIMFAPSGEVEYIMEGGEKRAVSDTIYFLIGRWDRIAALDFEAIEKAQNDNVFPNSPAEDGLWNYEDPTNFWVTVNPRTGVVSTAEVSQPFAYGANDLYQADGVTPDGVVESREFARVSKRNTGGR